jgi:hypothetical protein
MREYRGWVHASERTHCRARCCRGRGMCMCTGVHNGVNAHTARCPALKEGPGTWQAVACAFASLCLPPEPARSLPPQRLAPQRIHSLARTRPRCSRFCKCCARAPAVFCRFTRARSFRCRFQVLWRVYLGIYYPIPLARFIPGHPAHSSRAPLDLAKKKWNDYLKYNFMFVLLTSINEYISEIVLFC